jgi:hypothetical protein
MNLIYVLGMWITDVHLVIGIVILALLWLWYNVWGGRKLLDQIPTYKDGGCA